MPLGYRTFMQKWNNCTKLKSPQTLFDIRKETKNILKNKIKKTNTLKIIFFKVLYIRANKATKK